MAPDIIETPNLESFKESVLFLLEKAELLSAENAGLKRENIELKRENVELRARLNQNSSRPPSGDGYRKAAKITKTETSKPQGGQRGHKGNTLRQVDSPDETVSCCPGQCVCGHTFMGTEDVFLQSRRQVFDVPQPQLTVTGYQIFECKCPDCGKISQGSSPGHVNSPVQYGSTVKASVVLMNSEYRMPIKKSVSFLKFCTDTQSVNQPL
jgi:transposase